MNAPINRREFVKTGIAAGTLVMASGSLLGACSGIQREDMPTTDPTRTGSLRLDGDAAAILHEASLAPSGHNAQPWTVTLYGPRDWAIGLDTTRRLPVVDPDNREALLSIGAFTENLVIAAGARGYDARVEVIATDMQATGILRVRLKQGPKRPYPLKRLALRRTVKHGLRAGELTTKTIRALSEPFDGRLHYFPAGTAHARCMAAGTAAAFAEQTRRDAAQKELAHWTRFSRKAAETHRDGLTTEGMEITGLAGWVVRIFMTQADVMGDDWRKRGIETMAELTREGAGWFVVTSAGSTVADIIDTGRRFQRMALLAREHRVAIHPMTQMLEEKKWRDRIFQDHGAGMVPQFILRVGYLDRYPEPVSLRRPVSWFVRS